MGRLASIVVVTGLFVSTIAALSKDDRPKADLTAHEWGTFTSVAGEDGRAIEWRALSGATDLPCFVNRAGAQGWINKLTLMATVRMETPVIYFYSPHQTGVTAKVRFPKGLMTEWYPRANGRTGE